MIRSSISACTLILAAVLLLPAATQAQEAASALSGADGKTEVHLGRADDLAVIHTTQGSVANIATHTVPGRSSLLAVTWAEDGVPWQAISQDGGTTRHRRPAQGLQGGWRGGGSFCQDSTHSGVRKGPSPPPFTPG